LDGSGVLGSLLGGLHPDETKVRWLEDSPPNFTTNEQATLQFPQNLPVPSTVDGDTSYWLRAVITGGYYGQPPEQRKYNSYYESTLVSEAITANTTDTIVVDSADGLKVGDTIRLQSNVEVAQEEHKITNIEGNTITVDKQLRNNYEAGARVLYKSVVTETIPATYDPPIVKSLQLTYNFSLDKPVSFLAINDFTYFDGNDLATTISQDTASGDKVIQLEDVGNLAVSEFVKIAGEE
ncbi:MAG: hypothetical protein F6K47_43430, partial [Symploca sp. SIO2E6]|nr:hypothetical protein [Symploca sp. SIO2E6]